MQTLRSTTMNNFSKYRKLALVLPLTLGLSACNKGLDEINANPNNPEVGTPAFLLTNAERSNVFRLFDVPANQDGGLLIVQYWAKAQYTTEDRYGFRPGSYQSIWDGFYAGGLQDLNQIKQLSADNPNQKAVASIMSDYLFSVLTDIYGDIPYSEALRISEGKLNPKYDSQQEVYASLIADLGVAANALNSSGKAIEGDIIYGGDADKWKRFANSLRLRLAMRQADANDAASRTVVAQLLNGSTSLIASNEDNAQLDFLGATPNTNPVYVNRLTRDDHRVSRTLVSRLTRLNDPRLSVFADHPACGDSTAFYRGIPNGLSNAEAAGFNPLCSTSKVGSYFTGATAPGVLMTYAEVLFFKSEAIARGYITGDAALEYRNAITASMSQYGFTGTDVATYLAQPAVAYNAANYKLSIGNQKWIALYGQGIEAWSEFRRLDAPVLRVAKRPVSAAGGRIPARFPYPALEQSLNQTNYAVAVARQGADVLSTKLWWDRF